MNMLAKIEASADEPAGAGALVPRSTVETLVRQRNAALLLYGEAHWTLDKASAALQKAAAATAAIAGRENRYNYHQSNDKAKFTGHVETQPHDDYMRHARKIVDTDVWSRIVEITDLERLMDKQAKDELHRQLVEDPPEATVDNIFATLERFAADAGTIFRRGIANCFSKLDRRFRSHDGFKIGSRLILDRMFDEHGWWNYHRDMESTLLDIERTFMVVEGLAVPPTYSGIVGKLRNARQIHHGARQTETEDEYFLIRCYKNGNAHVWFKRDDLLEKVNKLLAEYYGEAVGDGMTKDDGGLHDPKTSLAKNYGFFPTPDAAAEKLLDDCPLHRGKDDPPLTILEPSAGGGNLARLLAAKRTGGSKYHGESEYTYRHDVDCVEVEADRAASLRGERKYRKVYCCDFLAMTADPANLYDRVVMNPPFDRERDIDHVVHALKFLKSGGFLTAIMSAGTEFRETKKSSAFRALMTEMKARWSDLPAGSFSSVGTNVNTIILRVWNDGRNFY